MIISLRTKKKLVIFRFSYSNMRTHPSVSLKMIFAPWCRFPLHTHSTVQDQVAKTNHHHLIIITWYDFLWKNDRGSNERWQAEPKRLIFGHKWIKRESTYKKGPMNFDFSLYLLKFLKACSCFVCEICYGIICYKCDQRDFIRGNVPSVPI